MPDNQERNFASTQVADAVTQTGVAVLGDAPATAMGALFQSAANAIGLSIQNAVGVQQQLTLTSQVSTTQGVASLYTVDVASTAEAAEKVDQSDIARWITILQAVTGGASPSP